MEMEVGDVTIEVNKKAIENVHLSVYPPDGRVTLAAPEHLSDERLRLFVTKKLAWIKEKQRFFKSHPREAPKEYIEKESHYYLGKRLVLQVIESSQYGVKRKGNKLMLHIKPNASFEKREQLIEEWYREQFKAMLPKLTTKWESSIGRSASKYTIRKMRTKWGSCNPDTKHILLNLELIKKPKECIEYILAHELVHLHERNHNQRFIDLMNHYHPGWREVKNLLNSLPYKHEDWEY